MPLQAANSANQALLGIAGEVEPLSAGLGHQEQKRRGARARTPQRAGKRLGGWAGRGREGGRGVRAGQEGPGGRKRGGGGGGPGGGLASTWRVLGEYLASTWRVLGEYLASTWRVFTGGLGGVCGVSVRAEKKLVKIRVSARTVVSRGAAEKNIGENRSFC